MTSANSAKIFHRLGIVAIVVWCATVVFAAWTTYKEPAKELLVRRGWMQGEPLQKLESTRMTAGESWMILRKADKPIGFIHQTRTRTPNGWLLENDFKVGIELMQSFQKLNTKVKSTLREDTSFLSFTATLKSKMANLSASGKVVPGGIEIDYNMGSREGKMTLPVSTGRKGEDGTPLLLLAESIPSKLVAAKSLTPGESFVHEYFDPASMSMKKSTWTYMGPSEEMQLFDTTITGNRFMQKVGGEELATVVDDTGDILYQQMPLGIEAVRYRADVAKALISRIDREWEVEEKAINDKKSGAQPTHIPTLEITTDPKEEAPEGTLLQQISDLSQTSFVVNLPTLEDTQLDSRRQSSKKLHELTFEIDTSQGGDDEKPTPDYLATLLHPSPFIDFDSKPIQNFIKAAGISPEQLEAIRIPSGEELEESALKQRLTTIATNRRRVANRLASDVSRNMSATPDVGIRAASGIVENPAGDCTEFSLLLATLLRGVGVEARFAYGLKRSRDGSWIPHEWVQYWDGNQFTDIDATTHTTTPKFTPTHDTLQLFVSDNPFDGRFVKLTETTVR